MPLVFACIAPHGGHLLLPDGAPTPVPQCRAAMRVLRDRFQRVRPDAVAVLTPHGEHIEHRMSLGVAPTGYGELDGVTVSTVTDLELASAWGYRASELGIPVAPVTPREEGAPFPLDWGVTIPLTLLCEGMEIPPTVVACPSRSLTHPQLVDWGTALVDAADERGKRVALVVSADQGHGHAADGPYGFTPRSAEYDAMMQDAIRENDLPRLLTWDADFAEDALADSYWQTLSLIGVQKRVPLQAEFLAYEVDHYFGLLCASFMPE